MQEEIGMAMELAEDAMKSAVEHLETGLTKIRAGKANPSMLDTVQVDYYGSTTPLNQVANVKTIDGRTLSVQPWEKAMLEEIEKGITNANIGLNPQNNGEMIMINIPVLTEERRRDLVKQAKSEGENAKVSIRNGRKEANDEVKQLLKDGLSEDQSKDAEDEIQKLTDRYIARVDAFVEAKEKDIMTV